MLRYNPIMEYIAQDPITKNCYQIDVNDGRVFGFQAVRQRKTNLNLTPGFCDLQVNGGFGIDLNAPGLTLGQVIELNHEMLRHGVTRWCPTVITADVEAMCRNLNVIAEACWTDTLTQQCVSGIHLEGPFLSPLEGARGAHSREFIRLPEIELFQRFQSAAGGRIRLVTLAPEIDGALALIEHLAGQGVLVALGHTLATDTQIDDAVQAGAGLATHLGNGLPAKLDRHDNPFLHMLLHEELWASVILDGHHLPVDIRKLMRKAKGIGRLVMVSDATRLVGMEPGLYDEPIGGAVELNSEGRLSLAGTPYLAGAAMTILDDANAMLTKKEFSLEEIIQMAVTQPRELMGDNSDSIVLLKQDRETNQISVEFTAINNEIVYNKENENE